MLTGVREAAGTCLGSLPSGGRTGPHPCPALLWSCKQARTIPAASSASANTSGPLDNGSRALDRANGVHARNSLAGRGASARRAAAASALERNAAEEEALVPAVRPGSQGLGRLVDAPTESTLVRSARRRFAGTPLVRASPTRDLPDAADVDFQQSSASRASPNGTAVESDKANPDEGGQKPLRRKRKPSIQAPPSGGVAAAAASGPGAAQSEAQAGAGDVGPGWLHSVLSGSGRGGGDGGSSGGDGVQSSNGDGGAPVRRRYSASPATSDRDGGGSGLRAVRGSESSSSSNASMGAGGSERRRGAGRQQTEERRHGQGEQEEDPGASARRRPASQQGEQPRLRRTGEEQQQEQQPPAGRAAQGQRRPGPGQGTQAGRGDGSRRAAAGGRGAAAGGAGEPGAADSGAWVRPFAPVDFAATCPSFAALDQFLDMRVAQGQGQGQPLHPVVMSGAFNHVVQLAQQASGNLRPENLRVVYKLQALFQPHAATCNTSRYLVNALWVCARLGAWGDGSFAAAMVDRLRQNNYALVRSAVGQAHGNLWWSLSQWAQQQQQQQQGQAGAEGLQGPRDVAQACWDVLEASAGAITSAPYLDQSSFKPQELANILLGAARLGYDHDHQLIHVLLSAFVRHPGPFKPQAVSNALYALGELLGSHDAPASAGSGGLGPGGRGGALHQNQNHNPNYLQRQRDAVVAAVHRPRATVQQEPWLSHVCGVAVLAVGELGLSSFKPQELSNLLIGCARLEVQLPAINSWALAPGAGGLGPGAATLGNGAKAGSASARDGGAAQLQFAMLTPRRRGQRSRGGGSPSGSPRGSRDSLDEDDDGGMAQRSGGEGEEEAGDIFLGRYDGPGGWGASDDEGSGGGGAGAGLGTVPTRQSPPSPDTVKWFVEELAAHVRTRIMADAPHASRAGWVSQALGNASWALARMGYMEQSYYAAVVHATCLGAMRTAKPQEWSNLFWALATVKHQPPRELVDVLYDTVRDTSWAAAEQAWCNVLWALAVLDLYEERLVSWIAHGAAQVGARRLTVTSLTNSLWALASMPDGAMAAQAPLVNMLVEEVNRRGDMEIDIGARVQLWQAQLEIDAAIRSGAAVALEPPSPPAASSAKAAKAAPKRASRSRLPLLSASAPAAAASAASSSLPALMRLSPSIARYAREGLLTANADLPDRRMTSLQLDVYGCAVFLMVEARTRAGTAAGTAPAPAPPAAAPWSGAEAAEAGVHIVRVEQEWLVEQLGTRVDMCLWLSDGRQVVVEVDGPSHYMCSDPRVKVPRAKLRDRQLERVYGKGNVISVPYWQWDYLGRQDTKRAYMQRMLRLA